MYNSKNQVHCRRVLELHQAGEISLKAASEKQQGEASDNAYNYPIRAVFLDWL